MKATHIETELNQITKRLDELTEARKDTANNLQALQKGFVDGTTTLDQLQSEHGKLNTLESSIKALEDKQSELHAAFQKASLSESRKANLNQMKTVAAEAETAFNDYLEVRVECDKVFAEYAKRLVDKNLAWREKQARYREIAGQIEPSADAQEMNLSKSTLNAATITTFRPPELEFGYAILAAESILVDKLTRQAKSEYQSEFNKRRANRADEMPKQTMSESENKLEYIQHVS